MVTVGVAGPMVKGVCGSLAGPSFVPTVTWP